MLSPNERFHRTYIPVTESGCFLWLNGLDRVGYAQFFIHGRLMMAHRYAYEQIHGAVPEGLELDHECRVRCCVNPDHLKPVTHKQNILAGTSPSAIHAKKTHCIRNHPFAGDNLRIAKDGERICLACARERYRLRKGNWEEERA